MGKSGYRAHSFPYSVKTANGDVRSKSSQLQDIPSSKELEPTNEPVTSSSAVQLTYSATSQPTVGTSDIFILIAPLRQSKREKCPAQRYIEQCDNLRVKRKHLVKC